MGELQDLESRGAGGVARIDFTASERRTKRLVSVESVRRTMGGRVLFGDLSFVLGPGTRLGLLGLNGSGKTMLLRLVAGELTPDAGTIERAPGLRIVYFDQAREHLEPTETLRQGLGANGDTVLYNGRPIHVAGWAKRFLFDAGRWIAPFRASRAANRRGYCWPG